MRTTPNTINDPTFIPKSDYNAIDRLFLNMIRDERDLPFVYLTLKITFTMVPMGLLLYIPNLNPVVWGIAAVLYFAMNNFVYKGSFGLMLHCTSHRPWFKKEYEGFNLYLPWFLGLFFGQTPKTYAIHHLGMHHRENNQEADLSSTMHYQRDSFRSFMNYFNEFLFRGIYTLMNYFFDRNQDKLAKQALRGELLFLAMCVALSFVNFWATFMVFILPFLISRYVMMLGNWTQHSFVDAEDPGNHYKNSITCVNVKYNKKCWNDGYHISHHIKPAMHWTEHPNHFKNNLKEYAENKALVFEGIDFLAIWFFLMRRNYDKLAKHVVNLEGMFASEEEAIELMKQRTQRIPKVSASEVEFAKADAA
jgi:fatty acid desaturase